MDRRAVLAAFYVQIRQHPGPDALSEHDERVIRSMPVRDGWTGVTWCDLDQVNADVVIAAGRVEFRPGTDFASLWGGGTLPTWRGRGVFRSLVAQRAAVASARGFRYLQVDASPGSRPILKRLGFVELATTTPFTHPGATAG